MKNKCAASFSGQTGEGSGVFAFWRWIGIMRKKNEGPGKIYLPAAWIRPGRLPPIKVRGRGDAFWFILRLAASASWEQGSEPPGSGRIFKQQKSLNSYESRLYAEDGT